MAASQHNNIASDITLISTVPKRKRGRAIVPATTMTV